LDGLRDLDLVSKCGDIEKDSETYKVEIAGLKFSSVSPSTLESLIVSYGNSLSTNPDLGAIKTAATDTLILLFPETKTAVESLDRAVNLLKDAHAGLVAGYENFKMVKDL